MIRAVHHASERGVGGLELVGGGTRLRPMRCSSLEVGR
jgi:hypothetical protein